MYTCPDKTTRTRTFGSSASSASLWPLAVSEGLERIELCVEVGNEPPRNRMFCNVSCVYSTFSVTTINQEIMYCQGYMYMVLELTPDHHCTALSEAKFQIQIVYNTPKISWHVGRLCVDGRQVWSVATLSQDRRLWRCSP
jgi:hypothetical protein